MRATPFFSSTLLPVEIFSSECLDELPVSISSNGYDVVFYQNSVDGLFPEVNGRLQGSGFPEVIGRVQDSTILAE